MKLENALKEQKEQTEQTKMTILGSLGIPLGGSRLVEVPNRNSFVYVQLRDNQNEVIQAFNNKVAPSYGLPVIVQREGTRYIVLGVDSQRYQNNWNSFAPYLPRHGNTHSRLEGSGGGGDVTWVTSNQFMPLLTIPSGSSGGPNVIVSPHVIQSSSGTWMYVGNTGTQSLLQYVPTGTSAVMVLVYLDRISGNPYIVVGSGSYFTSAITGTAQVTPYIPNVPNPLNHVPLGAIRLVSGTTTIGWDNIYDVRQYLQYIITGTAGGGLDTGTANALYLRLDTTNDPLTGQLDITPSTAGAGTINGTSQGNAYTAAFSQYMSGNQNVTRPILYLYRSPVLGTGTYSESAILVEQERLSGLISGKLLSLLSDSTERVFINPSAQGTGTNTMIDGDFVLSPGGMLLLLKNNGTPRFYVNASGTAYSNNVPLVKEAPIDGNMYVRKNAGWEVSTSSVSGSMNFQDEGVLQGNSNTLNILGPTSQIIVTGSLASLYISGSTQYDIFNGTSLTANELNDNDFFGFLDQSDSYHVVKVAYSQFKENLRLFFNNRYQPSGSVLHIQDEGIPQGTAYTMNFVGGGVDVSVSGTVARVFVTGTSVPEYGEYNPTFSSGTNTQTVQGTGWKYSRAGTIVTFSGLVQVDTGAVGAFTCYASLPIASNFDNANDASGNGTQPGAGIPNVISIREDQTNDRLQLDGYAQVSTNLFYRVVGQYIIK